jgi:exodeoxyribonuclease VIII
MKDALMAQMANPGPALISGLDMADYHADHVHVSRSVLVDLLRSPAHCYALHYDPARPPREAPTEAMVLGTLTHTATLEPEHFATRHPIAPKCDRRTTIGKADWAAFCATLEPGQEPADPVQAALAQAMAKSLRANTAIANLLFNPGEAEVSAYWVDEDTGVPCRVRPDWVNFCQAGDILFDVKTTIDASPAGFSKTVVNMAYDFQAAFYADGWEKASGRKVLGFVFGAVEKKWPFACAPYMLSEEDLDRARRKYKRALATLAECRASGVWPGYVAAGDTVNLLQLPAWATKETDE